MRDEANLLATIIKERRLAVAAAKRLAPRSKLIELAKHARHRSLVEALRSGAGTRIIAEVKKASPSAGLICGEYDPGSIAAAYERGGAAGISVLTEPGHFLGSIEHLKTVRRAVKLPILQKDFICDRFQLLEAAASGADVVLLIVAALGKKTLKDLHAYACDLGLEVILEVHTGAELERALAFTEAIIGVNNRNLKTLRTDLRVAKNLAKGIRSGRLSIAESGIRSRRDIVALERAGYAGFLVGEALLRGGNPAGNLVKMMGRGQECRLKSRFAD